MAASEANEDTGTPVPEEAAASEKSGSLRLLGVVAFSLFAFGFAVSYICIQQNAETLPFGEHPPDAGQVGPAEEPENPQALAGATVADLKRANGFFEQVRWDLALAVYQQIPGGKPDRSEVVNLRIAACLEGLGRWNEAVAAYRWVASHGQKPLRDTALLGQARMLIRLGRPTAAKNLLYAFWLNSSAADANSLAEGCYLLAFALSNEALPRTAAQPLDLKLVRPPLGTYTGWNVADGQQAAPPIAKADAAAPPTPVADGAPISPAQRKVTLPKREMPAKEALEELAKLGGVRITWTPRAVQLAAGRTTLVDVVDRPLTDVLQAVADPVNLLVTLKGKELHVADMEEADKEALATHRLAAAQRMLRGAARAYPGHVWTATAFLELGGVEEARGDLSQAQRWFERLVREWPRSPLVMAASYNLGVLYTGQGKPAQAVRAFYQAVDHGPGHELAAPALLHIGHIYLSQGEFRQALAPLRRAAAVAAGSDALPAAATTLAAAYVAMGKFRDANSLLGRYRDRLSDPRYRPNAAFLDAYALYKTAVARRETRREGVGLLTALLAIRKDAFLGDFGKYLVGKAFRDLGMWDEVVRSYEKIVQPSANPLIREMTLHLAEAYYMLKKPDRAISLLTALAERHKDSWAAAARLQLAAIALQDDRPRDCLQNCTLICQEHMPVEREALLHLMGEAYERVGEHDKAARCFAGQSP